MAARLRLSVVVVSHGRPRALARCLRAILQMYCGRFEVIVVADEDGLAAARSVAGCNAFELLHQEKPNISIARNTGLAAAAGEVVAFIDDDAVPEPTWADSLLAAFEQDAIAAATGPVLGRNGISLQWGRVSVDSFGRDRRLALDEIPGAGETLKLHGTNMAFRRDVFEDIGGFDPAYEFFLDDTDLALRLMQADKTSRYVSNAVVHHGFSASTRRTQDRIPLTLFDIGASTVVFLRKHASGADHGILLRKLEADQRARLLRLARRRKLDAAEIRRLMQSLMDGIEDGQGRASSAPGMTPAGDPFRTVQRAKTPVSTVRGAWNVRSRSLRKQAQEIVDQGDGVTLFLFEPTPRKHKMQYVDGGWWEQTGGLYGPADRDTPRVQAWTLKGRIEHEKQRIKEIRGL